MTRRTDSILGLSKSGFHRVVLHEWGDPANPRVLVCVHGLTRNGRDFDPLAQALSDRWRVVCPDVVGRGESDRLGDPVDYGFPQYLNDMTVLLGRIGMTRVDWLGTSMGGLIGMMLAAQPGAPIARLVLNDVGALLPGEALERIAGYVGLGASFADQSEAEAHVRELYAPFGVLTDAQWRHLTEHSFEAGPDGRLVRRYDPGIARSFQAGAIETVDLWTVWDRIACPTLLIRGARSDLLPREVAEEMTRRGPRAELVEIERCGHAPALMAAEQIALVRDWLLGDG